MPRSIVAPDGTDARNWCQTRSVKLGRLSLVDIAVAIVVLVALFLPSRSLNASQVVRLDDAARRELAFAEARAAVRPDDGPAVFRMTRLFDDAKQWDWAVQVAASAAAAAPDSPTRWRTLMAVSSAHIERYEAPEALDYATQAVAACERIGGTSCPSWEQIRLELYHRHLEAGVKSGIDPRKDPIGFRRAGETALRQVRTIGTGVAPAPAPAPAPQ